MTIAALTPGDAAELLVTLALLRKPLEVHLCNAYTLSLVESDLTLASALHRADLNLPDGAPVAFLGRRAGTSGPVRGPALVGDTIRRGVERDVRHYLFGGAETVAEKMAHELRAHAPGAQIVGLESPPFRPLSDADLDALARRVKASNAHIVWVGLGTPNQDYVVPRLAERVGAVVVPVGAAFNFWAGTVSLAPRWLHGTGLEWVWRLASEPRRLWRRYLFGNPRFILSAIIHARRPSS